MGEYSLLFFDDWHLHSRVNLDRHVGSPTLVPEGTLEDPYIDPTWGYPGVIQDPETGRWLCYYQGEVPGQRRGHHFIHVPVLAESEDGIHWEIPDLSDRVDLSERFVPHQLMDATRFREWCGVHFDKRAAGTDQAFKGMVSYSREDGSPYGSEAVLAASADGINWRYDESIHWSPEGVDPGYYAFWNPYRNSYVITLRPSNADRRVAITETSDWRNFSKPELMLEADALDTPCALIYGMPVFPYDQMFVALIWVFHTDPIVSDDDKFLSGNLDARRGDDMARVMGKIDCQLGYSRNGWHFQRTVRDTFIANTEPGEHGSGCIYPSSLIVDGDVIKIYSSSSIGEHAQFRAEVGGRQSALLLHTLRRDGFVYLEPPGGTGEFSTKWIHWGGGELELNVAVPKGEIMVQVMDHLAEPLEGYRYEDCLPFTGDSLSWRPEWRDGRKMGALKDQIVRLGVRLANGRIYSVKGNYEFKTVSEARRFQEAGEKIPSRPGF